MRSLQCWECTSAESWDHCSANVTQKTCPKSLDRCGKTKIEFNSKKYFVKACQEADACESVCEQFSDNQCTSECCEGDLCNADEVPLRCFECQSSISKEDCEGKAQLKTCARGQVRCSESMAVSNSTQLYAKGCATQQVCDEGVAMCDRWREQGKYARCLHRCCSGNLCNSAAASGSDIKCFTCDSQTSWEDCEQRRAEETCPFGKNRCATVSTNIETKHMSLANYRRACVSEATCENQEVRCNLFRKTYGEDTKCKIESDCCSEDLCNTYTAGSPTAGCAFTLLSCALSLVLSAYAFV